MKEIFEKILKQFPEAKGIAIIGVDDNRTFDFGCDCPQCQAEREILKQAKEKAEQELKQENPCTEMDLFQIGNTVLLPIEDSPECVISAVNGDEIELTWFDVNYHIQTQKFSKQTLKLAIICDSFNEK
jgi:hypothetical protein